MPKIAWNFTSLAIINVYDDQPQNVDYTTEHEVNFSPNHSGVRMISQWEGSANFSGKHERRENRGTEGIEGVGRGHGRGVSSSPGEKSEEEICPLPSEESYAPAQNFFKYFLI